VTGPSHASLFTSRYPTEVFGIGFQAKLGPEVPTLAEVLQHYGYATGAFVAGGALEPRVGLAPGFEIYDSPRNFGSLAHTVPLGLAWAGQAKGPFFLFVHGYDAHSPTAKPAPYEGEPATGPLADVLATRHERIIGSRLHATDADLAFIEGHTLGFETPEARALAESLEPGAPSLAEAELARVRTAYDDAVAWADVWFGRLLAGLAAQGRLDRTIVVVLADHGEQLGEHGYFGHGTGAGEEEAHVPLIIRVPGGAPRRESALVELVDVLPTIVELADAVPPAGIRGRSLVQALGGNGFPGREVAWTFGGNRYNTVAGRARAGRLTYAGVSATNRLLPTLIRAARGAGPRLTAEGEVPAGLREEMAAVVASLADPPRRGPPKGMSPEMQKEMRDHGYFGAEGGKGPPPGQPRPPGQLPGEGGPR
jgi:arylsulfatase A-like enzyme